MARQRRGGVEQELGGDLGGVHADLHDRSGAAVGDRGVRVGQPLVEAVADLGGGAPAGQRGEDLVSAHGLGKVPGEAEVAALGTDGGGGGVDRVEQAGGGDLGRGLVADVGAQAGLDASRDGRLGHDEDPGRHVRVVRRRHDSTFQKSRAVRRVPLTEPETFERVPSARGWYVTSRSLTRQPAIVSFCSSSTG